MGAMIVRLAAVVGLAALELTMPPVATAATYYVNATGGNDSNDGLSAATAWETMAKVNGSTFAAGDSILLKRGETWRESLVVPSSGTAGNPIRFDAYGTGAAPTITGRLDLPAAAWSVDSGNVWKATATASSMSFALFESIWGTKQTAKANVLADRDWYFASNTLYVHATSNPATYYGAVAAMLMAGGQLVYINGRSYVDVQHLRLAHFDTYGVRVGGAADHINVANVEAQGIIPNGTLPHGFYVSSTVSPAAINFYNDDAHRNYNGFRFDSTTGIVVKNCRAYANRMYGLTDNTANTVYSYSHFYGNSLGVLPSLDVSGGTDGGNNVAAYTWPGVVDFQRYPARVSFAVDDVGLTPGAETYIDTLTPEFEKRGLRMAMAVQTGYAAALVPTIQGWFNRGHDVNSHSWSHQYYTNPNAISIQYSGTGTAATLTIAGNRLTTTVTGGPGGENLDLDLTQAAYDTAHELRMHINGLSGYSASQDANCQDAAHTYTLADVSGQDIKSAAYVTQFQKSRLIPDEMSVSKTWMETNVAGLGAAKVYVYPAGIEDAETQGWAVAAGYEGSRGGLSMGLGVSEVYGKGVNIQDITSLGITSLHGLTRQAIWDRMAALAFKASVWGVPYGLFGHKDEITPAETGDMLDGLLQRGTLVMTNTQVVDFLRGTARVGATTNYVSEAPGREANFHAAGPSPVAGTALDLGADYQLDGDGRDRSVYGWDMGAVVVNPASKVRGSGAGKGTAVLQ
jgi:hypothetical protein